MQKLSDCSKSTKVPAGQISAWISSRVTTSPGRPARSSSTLKRLGLQAHRRPVAPQLAAAHVELEGSKTQREELSFWSVVQRVGRSLHQVSLVG